MKFKTLPTIVTETAQRHLAWGSEAVQKRRGVTRGHEALPGRKALFPSLNLVRVARGTWRPKGVDLCTFSVCGLLYVAYLAAELLKPHTLYSIKKKKNKPHDCARA